MVNPRAAGDASSTKEMVPSFCSCALELPGMLLRGWNLSQGSIWAFKFCLHVMKYQRIGDLCYWYLYKYGVIKPLSLGFEIKERQESI